METPELTPGVAFHLEPDGNWKAKKLPNEVLKIAEFSGYLTILGYRCSVFKTPSGESWAQKSTNMIVDVATRVANFRY